MNKVFVDLLDVFVVVYLYDILIYSDSLDDYKGYAKDVRVANSKPELSQLLFISIRQREFIKSSCWIGLSTYTSSTWSVH